MLLGILGTIVAARSLGHFDFGLFAIVVAATGFFQTLLDLTVEEAVIKYGFRYQETEDWGRLRRLFGRALAFKAAGGLLAGLALLGLAPAAETLFGSDRLTVPLLVAAPLPLLQSPETLAGAVLYLRGRYDVRSYFLAVSMAVRLLALALGAHFGVTEAVLALVLAQVLASGAISAAGLAGFRRFPQAPAESLERDRREIRRFVLQSSGATGILSLRTALAPLLLGVSTNPSEVASFRAAQAPQQGFAALSAPARMVLLTEHTRDWERGERASVFEGIRRFSLAAAALSVVVVVPAMWLMPDLIRIVLKPDFLGATDAARVILPAAAIQFVLGWTKPFPVSIGKPQLRVVAHGLETAVLLPLVVVLGRAWGATGAAVGVLASTIVFALVWAVLYARVRRAEETGAAAAPVVATEAVTQ